MQRKLHEGVIGSIEIDEEEFAMDGLPGTSYFWIPDWAHEVRSIAGFGFSAYLRARPGLIASNTDVLENLTRDAFPAVAGRFSRSVRAGSRRTGFSFAEVMFAVVILGIGFVMVAAIFPLAIEQTRSTADESVAAGLAKTVMNTIISTTTAADYPAPSEPGTLASTQPFVSQPAGLWPQVISQLISPVDHRYACVPFFCRSADGTVRITLLIVRRWQSDSYTPDDLAADLQPRGLSYQSITRGPDGIDTIVISKDSAGAYHSAAPGAFVIMTTFVAPNTPSGRIFRLANQRSETVDSVTWTLQIGDGLQPGESFTDSGSLAIIGRDGDPNSANGSYVGPAQDVAVYTTYLRN